MKIETMFARALELVRVFVLWLRLSVVPRVTDTFATLFLKADAKAGQKLGFVAAPFLPFLGGISTWLATRLVFATVVGFSAWGYIAHQRRDAATSATTAEHARLTGAYEEARLKAVAKTEAKDRLTAALIEAQEKKWSEHAGGLVAENAALADAIAKLSSDTTAPKCWPDPIVKSLQKKATSLKRPLK